MNITTFVAKKFKTRNVQRNYNTLQGWLTILLVPMLIQVFKVKEAEPNSNCYLTQGKECLLLALVTFAAILGRLFVHFTRKNICFRKMQVIVAILNVASFYTGSDTNYLGIDRISG